MCITLCTQNKVYYSFCLSVKCKFFTEMQTDRILKICTPVNWTAVWLLLCLFSWKSQAFAEGFTYIAKILLPALSLVFYFFIFLKRKVSYVYSACSLFDWLVLILFTKTKCLFLLIHTLIFLSKLITSDLFRFHGITLLTSLCNYRMYKWISHYRSIRTEHCIYNTWNFKTKTIHVYF